MGYLQIIFLFWLGLFPFVHFNYIYEGAKIVWLFLGGFVIGLVWVRRLISDKTSMEITWLDMVYLVWLLTLLVSSMIGPHPVDSLVGGSYRHQGVLTFFTLWLIHKTCVQVTGKGKELLIRLMTIAVVMQSLLLIVQANLINNNYYPAHLNYRPLGTFGEPNAAAGFLSVASAFILMGTAGRPGKIHHLALSLILAAILTAQSRSAILSFIAVICFWGFSTLLQKPGKLVKKKLILASIAVLMLVPLIILPIFHLISLTRPVSNIEDRIVFAKLGVEAVRKRPLMGYGAETGEWIYKREFSLANSALQDLIVDRSHNLIIDLLHWSGIAGLGAFGYWFFLNLKSLAYNKSFKPLAGVMGWITFGLLQPIGIVGWLMLFLLLALGRNKAYLLSK